ncbi:MAG: formylglycine-generating enzyme family protein [Pirellulaceae bacterium]|nr:formylglycine-generating enzyme family protein [Pirellulaceae bacterium]
MFRISQKYLNLRHLKKNQSRQLPRACALFLPVTLLIPLYFGCTKTSKKVYPSPESQFHSNDDGKMRDDTKSAGQHLLPSKSTTEIRFATIPGGTARLGSVASEPGRNPTLERMTTVNIMPFEMSISEITEAQWYSIIEPNRTKELDSPSLPITNITWYQATQFCELLTTKTGIVHRLPTEAEWEYACRGGSINMFGVWEGNCSLSDAITSFHRGDSGKLFRGIKASCNVDSGQISQVGQFPPNSFQLFDMHANCWEWISLKNTLSTPPSPLHAPIRGGSAIRQTPLTAELLTVHGSKGTKEQKPLGFG